MLSVDRRPRWMKGEEHVECMFIALPYGVPTSGQLFGPAESTKRLNSSTEERRARRQQAQMTRTSLNNIITQDNRLPAKVTNESITEGHDDNAHAHNILPWRPGKDTTYTWDNLPRHPLPSKTNIKRPECTTIPLENIPKIQGYEDCVELGKFESIPAPCASKPQTGNWIPQLTEFDQIRTSTEDECRQALMDHVTRHRQYRQRPAKYMKITDILDVTAYRYILETFTESRSASCECVPYRGGFVDGPEHGVPPSPWEVHCPPDGQFQDHEKKLEVPHTSVLVSCYNCEARGFVRCFRCRGFGCLQCDVCAGRGRVEHEICKSCSEYGRKQCSTCVREGSTVCDTCMGYRQLRCFVIVRVIFTSQADEATTNWSLEMPKDVIQNVNEIVVFKQKCSKIQPIECFSKEINAMSRSLVSKHNISTCYTRLVVQRHQLRAVPIAEVHYIWRKDNLQYWLCGCEREIYAPGYPERPVQLCSLL